MSLQQEDLKVTIVAKLEEQIKNSDLFMVCISLEYIVENLDGGAI